MTSPIRVVIADDQPLVRAGLRMILESEADLEIVGEAGDGRQAVEIVRRTQPDVVLMDIRMPDLDGIEATRLIARGKSNTEIATELFVAETTVKTHVGHVLTKLGLRDRVQAVALAYEVGLVRPGDGA